VQPRPRPHYRSNYHSATKNSDEVKESAPVPAINDSVKPGPAVAQPAATVTLADEASDKDLVAKRLKQVDDKLGGLSRNELHELDLVSYDHAKGFAASAHKALAEGDYTAAAGLAEKASALVNSLQAKGNSIP
jgi:hypothetical protein